jgi:hypothetical protein
MVDSNRTNSTPTAWTRWPHHLSFREPRVCTYICIKVTTGINFRIASSLLPSSLSPPARSTSRSTVRHRNYLPEASTDSDVLIDADLAGKPFFPGLIEYMNSGPICAMVWEGRDAVKTGRGMFDRFNDDTIANHISSHPRCHQPPCLFSRYHPW